LQRELGKTSIFVTHDVREALRLATRVALLVEGRVDTIGVPAEFRQASTQEARAFLACL
jgi:ABC-type proline/glycine betaine transport system ATPase subunit